MKMLNTARNNNNVYKLLTCIEEILFDCITRNTLLTIHELSQMDVALTSLKNVIESNQLDYQYLDALTFEVSCFRERKVPYISHSDGRMKFLTYEEAIAENTIVSADNTQVFNFNEVKSYKKGNLAIGQIFVDGKECFSRKLALEHSLKATALRWHDQLNRIKSLLKQKGVLENVIF